MLIDPFTVGAQIVNFLLLVWVLRRVLYGPVLRVMREREARVRGELEEAQRLREEAEGERERHQQQVAAFAGEQQARQTAARAEIETWRREQLEIARQEVDARRERWQQALAVEQHAAAGELRRRVGHEVLSLTRRALGDLADATLEERIVSRFVERLRGMPSDERARLLAAARDDGRRVHVRTAHALPDADRVRLGQAIDDALGAEVTSIFETSADLSAGIDLRAGGLKVAWSVSEYLASLEERLGEAFGDRPAGVDERA